MLNESTARRRGQAEGPVSDNQGHEIWINVRRRPLASAPSTPWWPDGAIVAVWPVVNVEWFEPGAGGPAIQPHLMGDPEIANYGWREYGNRAGLLRLIAVFRAAGIAASAAINADICARHPALASAIVEAGWEIMGHGQNNSRGLAGLSPQQEREAIATALETLERHTGTRPLGWLTPGFSVTARTPEALAACGLRYTADITDDDVPYALETSCGTVFALPYSLETNDISLCLVGRYTGPEYAHALVDHVRRLVDEGRPVVAALGLHTYIAGQPGRALHLERTLRALQAIRGVWFATGAEIVARLTSVAGTHNALAER